MAKTEKEPLTKHTLFLYSGDYEKLRLTYPELGGSIVIRRLLRAHLNKVDPQIDTSEIKGDLI